MYQVNKITERGKKLTRITMKTSTVSQFSITNPLAAAVIFAVIATYYLLINNIITEAKIAFDKKISSQCQ